MITLRSNQIEPVNKSVDFFKKPSDPSILVAPTAFGKSIVIAQAADTVDDKILIIQPSKELLEQNYRKYIGLGDGRYAGIYSASFNRKQIAKVTYATIGSIKKHGRYFAEYGFRKMIVDECHLYPRESNSMFGTFIKDSGITHVLGLTATPLKLQNNVDVNGQPYSKLVMLTSPSKKGQFFKDIIHVAQIDEMCCLGYWAKLEYEQYDMDESGLVYNSSKSDYTEESLKEVYKSNDTHSKVLARLEDLDPSRKSVLVFVPSVDEAQQLASQCENSAAVWGDMPAADRAFLINEFKLGRIRTIFNVNVLSVGFDHPLIDTIICARPTASLAWLYQALGRGTRIHPDKENCLIIDFSGNIKKFGKIEHLHYKKDKSWQLYGENGLLLTGVPLHMIGVKVEPFDAIMTFGKYKGQKVSTIPMSYCRWALDNVAWYDKKLKAAFEVRVGYSTTLSRGLSVTPSDSLVDKNDLPF